MIAGLAVVSLLVTAGPAAAATSALAELPEPARRTLLEHAARLDDAFRAKDHAGFVGLMHPRLVAGLGGRAAAIAGLEKADRAMRAEGAEILEAGVERVRQCARVKGQLQCVLDQLQRIRIPQGVLRARSDLLAFSDDGGKRWTFVAAAAPPEELRKAFPELSPALELRARQAPVLER